MSASFDSHEHHMYRSLTETNHILPGKKEELVPIQKPEDHLIKAPVRALSIYKPLPLGLVLAAFLVFTSGILGIAQRKLPLEVVHILRSGAQALSREALYPTQEKLVRPFGAPVASFIQGLNKQEAPSLRRE